MLLVVCVTNLEQPLNKSRLSYKS